MNANNKALFFLFVLLIIACVKDEIQPSTCGPMGGGVISGGLTSGPKGSIQSDIDFIEVYNLDSLRDTIKFVYENDNLTAIIANDVHDLNWHILIDDQNYRDSYSDSSFNFRGFWLNDTVYCHERELTDHSLDSNMYLFRNEYYVMHGSSDSGRLDWKTLLGILKYDSLGFVQEIYACESGQRVERLDHIDYSQYVENPLWQFSPILNVSPEFFGIDYSVFGRHENEVLSRFIPTNYRYVGQKTVNITWKLDGMGRVSELTQHLSALEGKFDRTIGFHYK